MKGLTILAKSFSAMLLISALLVPACFFHDDDHPPCNDDDYPRCVSAQVLAECLSGRVFERECSAAMACLDIVSSEGHRFSQCLPEGAATCDVEGFAPSCLDNERVMSCVAPLGFLDAGHTFVDTCREGYECRTLPGGDFCVLPGSQICDPDSFPGACDGEQPVACSSSGMTYLQEACSSPQRCAVGSRGARCVDPEGEPCDSEGFGERCEDDGVLRCSSLTGFTSRRACEAGQRCRESHDSAQCFGPDQPDCDAELFEPACEDNARLVCSRFGVVNTHPCDESERCRVVAGATYCIDESAEPCDPQTFATFCDDDETAVSCNSITGYTRDDTCGDGQSCKTSAVGSFCVDEQAEPCDPATYESFCQGEAAHTCNFFNGFTWVEPCDAGQLCGTDDLCWTESCFHSALCMDASLPTCEEPAGFSCDGNRMLSCFDGRQMATECPEDHVCAINEDGVPVCEAL